PVTCCVKFGITSRDGYARLRTHRVDGFTEALRLITGLPEGLAVLTEQKIKLALAMVEAKPMRGREYCSDEHLALIENEIDNWVPGALAAQDPKPFNLGDGARLGLCDHGRRTVTGPPWQGRYAFDLRSIRARDTDQPPADLAGAE